MAINNETINELNSRIIEAEKNLDAVYAHIGKLYCNIYKNAPRREFECLLELKGEREKTLETLRSELRRAKGLKLCPACKCEHPEGDIACPKCGFSTAPRNRVTCPSCGSVMEGDMNFCVDCGASLNAARPNPHSKRFCRKCGAPTDETMTFCVSCGTKV